MKYKKPMVTIELEEYNELLEKKKFFEAEGTELHIEATADEGWLYVLNEHARGRLAKFVMEMFGSAEKRLDEIKKYKFFYKKLA